MPVCDPPPDKFGKLVSNFTIKPRWMLSQPENNQKKKINNMKKMQKKTKKKRRFVIRSKNSKPSRKRHRKRRRRGGQDKSSIQNDVETKWGNHVLTCSERFENCIATVFSDGTFWCLRFVSLTQLPHTTGTCGWTDPDSVKDKVLLQDLYQSDLRKKDNEGLVCEQSIVLGLQTPIKKMYDDSDAALIPLVTPPSMMRDFSPLTSPMLLLQERASSTSKKRKKKTAVGLKKKKTWTFGSPRRSCLDNSYLQSPMSTRQKYSVCDQDSPRERLQKRRKTSSKKNRSMSLIEPLPPAFHKVCD